MQIRDEDQYQDAVTEMKRLEPIAPEDEQAAVRLRELEAAVEAYTLSLEGHGHRKGRPRSART